MRTFPRFVPALLAGWALMFGKPGAPADTHKAVAGFTDQSSCQAERQQRAEEVRQQARSGVTFEQVLAHYHCEPADLTPASADR